MTVALSSKPGLYMRPKRRRAQPEQAQVAAQKNCAVCGAIFGKRPRASMAQWASISVCSRKECRSKWQSVTQTRKIDEVIDERSMPEPNSGCWLWTGKTNKSGYGVVFFEGGWRLAHRVVYERHSGKAPRDLIVRHKCNNALCVNPQHLVVGTQAENIADMLLARRHPKLQNLSPATIQEIRDASGSFREIGRRYGVGHPCVARIKRGLVWRGV